MHNCIIYSQLMGLSAGVGGTSPCHASESLCLTQGLGQLLVEHLFLFSLPQTRHRPRAPVLSRPTGPKDVLANPTSSSGHFWSRLVICVQLCHTLCGCRPSKLGPSLPQRGSPVPPVLLLPFLSFNRRTQAPPHLLPDAFMIPLWSKLTSLFPTFSQHMLLP